MDILTIIEIGCGVVTAASGICALTPTPDPTTPLGKFYRLIEYAGLVVGKAKESGMVPPNPAVDAAATDAIGIAKGIGFKVALLAAASLAVATSACSTVPPTPATTAAQPSTTASSILGTVSNGITNFATKAEPVIAKACSDFAAAEQNPLVQMALPPAEAVAGAAIGAVTGGVGTPAPAIAVAAVKSFGDSFCAAGPPAGDTTTPSQQAAWLGGVTQQLLTAAGAALPAIPAALP